MKLPEHKEVMSLVKMPLDEKIVPLVQALNKFNGILTCESCECRAEDNQAFVQFCHYPRVVDGDYMPLFLFAIDLNDRLRKMFDSSIFYTIRLGWFYGGEEMSSEITVPPKDIIEFSRGLVKISRSYNRDNPVHQ